MKNKFLAVLFGAALVLGACGGDKADETDTGTDDTTGTETASVDAEAVVSSSCINCHGGNLEGVGGAPALSDVGSRLSESEIHDIIVNGQGGMPGGLIKDEAEIEAVSKWLAAKK